jgi:hypothetical protein
LASEESRKIQRRYNPEDFVKVHKVREALNKFRQTNSAIDYNDFADVEISADVPVGDAFRPIQKLVDMMSGEATELVHQSGIVLVLSFWSLYGEQLNTAHKISADLNYRYPGKVRVVSVSFESKEKEEIDRMKANFPKAQVEYFFAHDRTFKLSHPVKSLYKFTGFPHYVIVDAKGVIAYRGESDKDFESMIGKLFEEKGKVPQANQTEETKATDYKKAAKHSYTDIYNRCTGLQHDKTLRKIFKHRMGN